MKNGNNMKWLLWKEYRQNRLIVFVMLFLLIAPYVLAVYAMCRGWPFHVLAFDRFHLARSLAFAGVYSLSLSQFAMALIGGNVIAGERVDRSAEFQAYLPIRRSKILTAKLLLALLIAAVIWLPNVFVQWGTLDVPVAGRSTVHNLRDFVEVFAVVASVGLTFFCVAWFFSSFVTSPVIAVCAGLTAPVGIFSGIRFIAYFREIPEDPLLDMWFTTICLTLSPICFVLGTWLYLRRVEA